MATSIDARRDFPFPSPTDWRHRRDENRDESNRNLNVQRRDERRDAKRIFTVVRCRGAVAHCSVPPVLKPKIHSLLFRLVSSRLDLLRLEALNIENFVHRCFALKNLLELVKEHLILKHRSSLLASVRHVALEAYSNVNNFRRDANICEQID